MSRLRIRSLKPEFFGDEKICSVSRDARYLAVGLITRADDRGRQQNLDQAILGHVYPSGDVSLRQVARWLAEIVEVRFVWPYEVGPFAYLWLPHFWRHQKINRPTESSFPAHCEDPYQELPIKEAIKAFRTDHGLDQNKEKITEKLTEFVREDLTPPRAGARSAPILSSSSTSSQGPRVTRELIDNAITILSAVTRWEPDSIGVENAAAMHPDTDLLQGCRLAVTWASDPSWEVQSCSATLRSALRYLEREAKGSAGKRPGRESPSDLLRAMEAPV